MNHHKKLRREAVLRAGWAGLVCALASLAALAAGGRPAAAQQAASATPGGVYVTVTYIEPINVRSGPGSYDYPVIGSLPVGGTAPALGHSPAGEWIEIAFAAGPRGVGWVYAANVSLSAGPMLPVVEPPPTPTPAERPTTNPTFVAQFRTMAAQLTATTTALPTFTPPPPLAIPTYVSQAQPPFGREAVSGLMVALGVLGVLGMLASLLFRRR